MPKKQKIQLLLDHCQRRGLILNLLAALEKDRPDQYQRQFGSVAVDRGPALGPRERDPKQVFISHAHEDAAFAQRLADDLRSHGWRAWIAPDSILPGEKWAAAINRALEESGVFVLVLTPAALRSDWVTTETSSAIALQHQRKIRFIPLEVAHCQVPPLWDVYQRVPFVGRYEDGLSALLALMEAGPTPRLPPITRPRWLWPAVGGMVGLLAVIVYALLQINSPGGKPTPSLTGTSSAQALATMTSEITAILPAAASAISASTSASSLPVTARVTPEPGATMISPVADMVMVWVPGGEFTMGSGDADAFPDAAAFLDEKPQHELYVEGFWISHTEVTNAQYAGCVKVGACAAPDNQDYNRAEFADRPVTDVSWDSANEYARWTGGRLPTEAEWEKACRGTDARVFPGGTLRLPMTSRDLSETRPATWADILGVQAHMACWIWLGTCWSGQVVFTSPTPTRRMMVVKMRAMGNV